MAESKYSLRLAAVDAFSKTFGDFSKKADQLQDEIKGQRAELDKLNRAARDADGYSKLTEKLERTKGALQQARVEQASLGRAHEAAAAQVERLGQEYVQAQASLKALSSSTEASKEQVRNARDEHARLGRELASATAEVKKLDGAQDRNTASLRTLEAAQRAEGNELKRLQAALTAAGVDTGQLASEQKRLETATEQANAALQAQRARLDAVRQAQDKVEANRNARADLRGQVAETAAIGYLAAKPIDQAMNLDSGMAEVAKTVNFEGDQRERMAQANLALATERLIAAGKISAVELTEIEAAAGRIGIGKKAGSLEAQHAEIISFTRDAAIMGSAFGMAAGQAGETMAGWRASMLLSQQGAMDLADATNHLGNNFNLKTADLAGVIQRFGAVGTASGLRPEQTAALSAAFLNPGTAPEIAGTGFKNFTSALVAGKAATKGQKEQWKELGFDPEELAADMQRDAPKTIMAVLEALKAAPKEEQAAIATTLFGSESIGAIQPLLLNLGEVEKAFGLVGDKSKYAGSMLKEAEGSAATSRTSWNVFTAKLTRLSTLIGTAMLPALDAVLAPLGAMVDGLSWAAETFPDVTAGLAVAAGALAALKVGALGLKFAGLLVGQAFNKAGLARAKLDATTARTAVTADAAVGRLNGALARLGGLGGGAGGGRGRGRGRGGKGLGMAGKATGALVLATGAVELASLVSDDADAEQIGGSVGSTAGSLGGMYAGAAAGAALGTVVPVIGTAAGGLVGGAIGGLAGSSAGEWIGEKLGALVDRLSDPDTIKNDVVNNTSNQQLTFAPSITLQASGDPAYDQRLADQVIGRLKGEFVPLMMANPLDIRRGAALTDGSN